MSYLYLKNQIYSRSNSIGTLVYAIPLIILGTKMRKFIKE